MTTFECPDCYRTHAEPADATLVLSVICLDCRLAQELDLTALRRVPSLPAAA